ncbi:MAG: hypothetical protein KJ060_14685 [Candidatus Hydrogenedentes bacterium]|nr:hypothetical protein [Candidatus Hydrogenedentota bacterium]
MNTNSTYADAALRRERSGLGGMIKALAWEECRVAGVIAGWCVIVGLLCLAFLWTQMGGAAWNNYREFTLLFVVGAPMLTALLLILSTDYSGHLVGGFSERILHLPAPVSAAVGVAFAARTAFVFVTALLFMGACEVIFGESPGFGSVLAVTLVYVAAQTVDWLRKPLSGLTTLLCLSVILAAFYYLTRSETIHDGIRGVAVESGFLGMLLLLSLAPAYGIGVAAVHAARVGRGIGVPEFWEWPRYISAPLPGRSRPFRTPLAAQVWFDLRRSWWVLPLVTAVVSSVIPLAMWLIADRDNGFNQLYRLMLTLPAFAGVAFGAVIYGATTGLAQLRRGTSKSMPQLLHPLTSAQFAFARLVCSAMVLIPVLLAVLVLHFVVAGEYFVTTIIPDALTIGVTSYREVLWVLLSRGILVGLIAWPLMNGGNRTIAGLLALEGLLTGCLFSLSDERLLDWQDTRILLPAVAIAYAVATYIRAWRSGVLSVRSVLIAAGVWAVTALVLYHPLHTAAPSSGYQGIDFAEALITCLGWAALIPLPFAGVALEVRRRRHSAAAAQDPAQQVAADATLLTGAPRTVAYAMLAIVVLTFVWLGWPVRPAYESYWRAHGYPVTLEELDAWYPAVPDDENRALKYMEVAEQMTVSAGPFWTEQKRQQALDPTVELPENVLVVGSGESERGVPFNKVTWDATERYWQAVTSHVAPELKRLGQDESMQSRYNLDLRYGFAVDLPQLAKIRELARELALDSLHWTIADQPNKAVESIEAMVPLANSLDQEPLLISQLVRIAVFGIAYDTTEDIMSRSVLRDDALAKLNETFADAMPASEERMILDRAMIGEATMSLRVVASPDLLASTAFEADHAVSASTTLFWQMAGPAEAERMAMLRHYARLLSHSASERTSYGVSNDDGDWIAEDTALFTPFAAITLPATGRAYDAEWRIRTQFDIARAAIAVERYRLASGVLPDTLQQLVPNYLAEVPMDYYAEFNEPLGYRRLGDTSYVVYSIGQDRQDDQGVEMENWWNEGDITFTVAPLSVRTGPQIVDIPVQEKKAEAEQTQHRERGRLQGGLFNRREERTAR